MALTDHRNLVGSAFAGLLALAVLIAPRVAISAEKSGESFEQVLDGFDKLAFAGRYAEAAAHLKSKGAKFAGGATAARHRAATAIAGYLVKCGNARAAALKNLVGKKISIRYKSGARMSGVFKSISGDQLHMTVRYKLGAGWTESPRKVKIEDLAAGELARLLPFPAPESADEHVGAAIAALGRDDFDAARESLKAGAASALAPRYDGRLETLRKARVEQLARADWRKLAGRGRETLSEAQARLLLIELKGFEKKWGTSSFAAGRKNEIKKLRAKAELATGGGIPGSTRWPEVLRGRTPVGRRAAIAKYGGSAETEKAVEAALAWLARHQGKDGCWDNRKLGGSNSFNASVGCTALGMLAMLSAGNTEKHGKYAANIKRAQDWLIKQQQPDGLIRPQGYRAGAEKGMYDHAMAALALAESVAMGGDRRLVAVLNKAAEYSVNKHQGRDGGWRYTPKGAGDTSLTAWFVAHLLAARRVGCRVPDAGLKNAAAFFDKVTKPDGTLSYTVRSSRASAVMTAAGTFARRQMGVPASDATLLKGTVSCLKYLPNWEKAGRPDGRIGRDHSFYFWYHATNAMFHMGGNSWSRWNQAVSTTLVKSQRKGGPRDGSLNDVEGSWDLQGNYDKRIGRTYSAAMGALILETYYRYKPFGKGPDAPIPVASEPVKPEPPKPEPVKPQPTTKPNLDIPGDEEPG